MTRLICYVFSFSSNLNVRGSIGKNKKRDKDKLTGNNIVVPVIVWVKTLCTLGHIGCISCIVCATVALLSKCISTFVYFSMNENGPNGLMPFHTTTVRYPAIGILHCTYTRTPYVSRSSCVSVRFFPLYFSLIPYRNLRSNPLT